MVRTYYGNKIDNLEKKIWPHCPTEILQVMNGIGWLNVTTQKKSSLEQKSSLQNKIHDIINPKYLKKERGKNLKFPQE